MHPARLQRAAGTALLLFIQSSPARGQTAPPDGFEVGVYADGFNEPIALAEATDGRLFVAERGGAVHIVRDGAAQQPAFLDIAVYASGESGLLGMALDPQFASNGRVYFLATVDPREQRIIRVTEHDGRASETTIIRDNLPASSDFHNGGALVVGPDHKLYFSIGDTNRAELSGQMTSFAGKICRINLDGSVPADNPFVTPTGTPRAIYALGLRNVFRMCFSPDGRLFAGDVGSSGSARREEINQICGGADLGWPTVEGRMASQEDAAFTAPLWAYNFDGGAAITGCAFYSAAQFPAEFRGDLFHLDFVRNALYRLVLDGSRAVAHELFMSVENGPVDLLLSADGSLLYTELYSGRIMRLRYTAAPGAEAAPTPSATDTACRPNTAHGPAPGASTCGAGGALLLICCVIRMRSTACSPFT